MAVAFDKFDFRINSASFSYTPTGTPRAIITGVSDIATTDQVSSMTYGGVAMTEVALSPQTSTGASGDNGTISMFHLGASIPTGAQTVSFTKSGSTNYGFYVISLTAADDTEVVDTSIINSTSVENPSVTVSLGGRTSFVGMVFGSGQNATTGVSPPTGWTSQREDSDGAMSVGCYTYDTIGTSDVSAGATQTAEDFVAIAVAVSEVAAAGDPEGGLIGSKLLNGGLLLGGVLIR